MLGSCSPHHQVNVTGVFATIRLGFEMWAESFMSHYIGLDLGGTNIKAGVVDQDANVLASLSVPTPGASGPDAVIGAMADAAARVSAKAGVTLDSVEGIGIGSPGPLDFDRGLVLALPNLPGWQNVPLSDRIAAATGRPTILENDANAAAFGEFWAGAGRDPAIHHLVMFTLGTGVGSGLIVDGQVIHGGFNLGGEGGHMIVDAGGRLCACGQRGCLESYASASHTARRAEEAIDRGEPSCLAERRKDGAGNIEAKDVFDAAKAGDAVAERIVQETSKYLAVGCINICRLLDPQMIVFAGGMILAGDYLFDLVRVEFKRQTWQLLDEKVQIVPAQLGNDAGFIGSAAVARDARQRGRLG